MYVYIKRKKEEEERKWARCRQCRRIFMFIMFFSTYNRGNKMQTWERIESIGESENHFRKSFSSMTTIMVTLRKSTNFTPCSVFLSAAIKSSFLYKQILVLSKEFQQVLVKITTLEEFSKSFLHIKNDKKPEVFNSSWKHLFSTKRNTKTRHVEFQNLISIFWKCHTFSFI